ncbi:MAG: HDOD domain-containing protein, partial [Nitrospirota bacterium]|nr:HDOD domain-containing protein [Nitrospirota bacterium]
VMGYELLYRGSPTANEATFSDGDAVTARVMLNTFLEIGFDQMVGPHLAFINLTIKFLRDNLCDDLPKDRVVLEVLEDIPMDNDVLEAMKRLSAQGYTLALDDFSYEEHLRPMVELAQIIKLDVMALGREKLQDHVSQLRNFKVKLLAEKVETQEEFELCKTLGFDYFQGYFFCRPKIVEGRRIPPNQIAVLSLLTKLQNPDTEMKEVEAIIKQDISLSYKVLRYVNSAFLSLPKKVDAIGQAACLVGLARLKTWATLLVMAGLDGKPVELLLIALVRAQMCKELATALQEPEVEEHFTVGLFSVLDALFDQSMSDILGMLELSPKIGEALVERTGTLGDVLELVLAYERGEWDKVQDGPLAPSTLQKSYFEALAWKDSLVPLLDG